VYRIILGLLIVAFVLGPTGCSEPGLVERRWTIMGTYASAEIHAIDQGTAEDVLARIQEDYRHVDATMSNWREDSLLSRLNREARERPFVVEDPELFRCVKLAREFARRTGGAFDPTVGPLMRLYGFRPLGPRVPSDSEILLTLRHVGWERFEVLPEARAVRFRAGGIELDLGGIARGQALDIAARNFALPGVRAGLLDLGGTVYAWGKPPGGERWTVGIRDPQDAEAIMAVLELRDRAISTAGDYENHVLVDGVRLGHIMDARTGRPAASDVVSSTVISDSGIEADALSTAFFVAGSQRVAAMLEGARRIEVILVIRTARGPAVLASSTLRDRVEFAESFVERIDGRIRYIMPARM
jgi:thiamine biosynthesis lipoprotein